MVYPRECTVIVISMFAEVRRVVSGQRENFNKERKCLKVPHRNHAAEE